MCNFVAGSLSQYDRSSTTGIRNGGVGAIISRVNHERSIHHHQHVVKGQTLKHRSASWMFSSKMPWIPNNPWITVSCKNYLHFSLLTETVGTCELWTDYNLCSRTLIHICWLLTRKTETKSVKWMTTDMNMVILLWKKKLSGSCKFYHGMALSPLKC